MYPFPFPVNQMFPFASATSPCGPESSIFSTYSLKAPLAGSNRPSLFCNCSVNHNEPSGAIAGSCGCAPLVGTSHSLIVTFNSPTAAAAAAVTGVVEAGFSPPARAGPSPLAPRAARATATPRVKETAPAKKIPHPKISPTKIVNIRLLISTSKAQVSDCALTIAPVLAHHTSAGPRNEIPLHSYSLGQRPQQHARSIPKNLHANAHQQKRRQPHDHAHPRRAKQACQTVRESVAEKHAHRDE